MNYLSTEKRTLVTAALCEGVGVRATGRITGTDKDTVARLALQVGEGYARLHNKLFVRLKPNVLELDEAWSFVHTKQAHVRASDPDEYGDQYSFIALDAESKLIPSYHVGKRRAKDTQGFLLDLESRCLTKPQITTDGFRPYIKAIAAAFGPDADYAQCIKEYLAECSAEASRRYSPAKEVHVERVLISGEPDEDHINTSFVERQNLTLRMLARRWTRLTGAFSKSLRNHRAAMDLYVGYYNLCWAHETLKEEGATPKAPMTPRSPAMAAGVTTEIWTVERFTRECLALSLSIPPERVGDTMFKWRVQERMQERRR